MYYFRYIALVFVMAAMHQCTGKSIDTGKVTGKDGGDAKGEHGALSDSVEVGLVNPPGVVAEGPPPPHPPSAAISPNSQILENETLAMTSFLTSYPMAGGAPFWCNGQHGFTPDRLALQGDGNLCVYETDSSKPARWCTMNKLRAR